MEVDMTPEEVKGQILDWSVNEVYREWELFALNASIAAYDFAIARARKESDRRIAQVKEFLQDLAELHELNDMEPTTELRWSSKGKLVYTPRGKDNR